MLTNQSQYFDVIVTLENKTFFKQEDFFAGIYEDWTIKTFVILFHIISLFSVGGLVLILWFERSGYAGHFRTLINQLSSFNIEQVSPKKYVSI